MALEWLKQRYAEVSASLKTEVTKIKNKTFLESVVAGWCAVRPRRRGAAQARGR